MYYLLPPPCKRSGVSACKGADAARELAHARENAGENDDAEEDPNTEIDRAMLALVWQPRRLLDLDLISGRAGMGVYALERLPAPRARGVLAQIVLRLDEQATRTAAGITWLTRPELLPDSSRQRHPRGHYNLGAAHGIPGVIALLAQIVAADIEPERASTLPDGAIRWLLAQEMDEAHSSAFPWALVPGEPPGRSRLAWCYGDAGIAGTLMTAALATGDTRLQAEAARIGRRAALRPPDNADVVDTGLCHGSAGLALIFQRLYQATGDQVFAGAVRYWIRDTLDRRQPGQGVAGLSHPSRAAGRYARGSARGRLSQRSGRRCPRIARGCHRRRAGLGSRVAPISDLSPAQTLNRCWLVAVHTACAGHVPGGCDTAALLASAGQQRCNHRSPLPMFSSRCEPA